MNEVIFADDKKEKVNHSEVALNGGFVYLSDGTCLPEQEPETNGAAEPGQAAGDGFGFMCHLDVEDPHATWKKAMSNGAVTVTDLKVQFWGDLYGSFKDPFGFEWSVSKAGDSSPRGVIPYLLSPAGDCQNHIDWLKAVFGAEVKEIFHNDDKKVMHCSLVMNNFCVYLADGPSTPEQQQQPMEKPRRLICHLDLQDPKAVWESAMKNEATTSVEFKVQFWGDLYGCFKDTFGFEWSVAEVKPEAPEATGVIPYIVSPDCEKHVEWLKNVFGGELKEIYRTDDNKVMHCSVVINKGYVYLADRGCSKEQSRQVQGDPCGFLCHLNVPDPNLVWEKAMSNGATTVMELKMQFWGGFWGSFRDPFGYEWAVLKDCS